MSNLDNSRSHSFVVCIRHNWHWPICVLALLLLPSMTTTITKKSNFICFVQRSRNKPAWWPLACAGYVGRRSLSAYHFISFRTWTIRRCRHSVPNLDFLFCFVSAFSLFNVMCSHLPISSINSRRCQTQTDTRRTPNAASFSFYKYKVRLAACCVYDRAEITFMDPIRWHQFGHRIILSPSCASV